MAPQMDSATLKGRRQELKDGTARRARIGACLRKVPPRVPCKWPAFARRAPTHTSRPRASPSRGAKVSNVSGGTGGRSSGSAALKAFGGHHNAI